MQFSRSRRSNMPRPPFRGNRCKPLVEVLEDRAVPALLLSGDMTTLEGANYALSLQDTDNTGVIEYQIDWGDGSAIETVAAAQMPGVFTHLYADGPLNATISVQSIVGSAGPAPDAAFFFDGNLDNAVADGAPLVAITNPPAPSGFEQDSTGDTIYRFSTFSGFSWSTVGVLSSSSDYTIEMRFHYDPALTAFRKFLDFDNLTLDGGWYVLHDGPTLSDPDALVTYPQELASGDLPVQEWWHVTLTRSAATNEVVVYMEGAFAFSFFDHAGDLKVGADNTLHFFLDDAETGGGETGAGEVSRIRVFNEVLDSDAVAGLFSNSGGGTSVGGIATLGVQVENVDPVYVAPPNQIGRPAAFDLGSFTDAGLSDGDWTVTVSWGDGSSDLMFTVEAQGALSHSHDYAKNGKYTVTVTVTDKDGGSASGSFEVHLKGNPKGMTSETPSSESSGPGNSGAQIDWNSLAAHVFGGKK
jgi:hypothetical protein